MPLSDYTGRTPRGESELVVGRVAPHHRWNVDVSRIEQCPHCGADLDLHERHLLVTLSEEAGTGTVPTAKRYLCDEDCLRGWLDGE